MGTYKLVLPERVANREQARQITAELPARLGPDDLVVVEAGLLAAAAPSFMDELVKIILVEKQAGRLKINRSSARAGDFARSSAQRRDVAGSLRLTS